MISLLQMTGSLVEHKLCFKISSKTTRLSNF